MNTPPQRRIVPPAIPAGVVQRTSEYVPPPYVAPPRMARWQRNLLVWGLCLVVIVVTMIVFVNVMLSEEFGKLLAPYR
jgi:hypothetical protein